jgi:glutamate 5-kinase
MSAETELAELEAALQAKRSGRSVVKVASGGRAVEYDKLSIADLEAAIQKKRSQIAGAPRRGAIRPFFG